jgi:hypothetical protein
LSPDLAEPADRPIGRLILFLVMNDDAVAVTRLVDRNGGIASRATLLRAGASPRSIERACQSKLIVSERRGLYASATADLDQRRAVRLGGLIGCLSALRRSGVWAGLDTRLHVHVPAGSKRLRVDDVVAFGRDTRTPRNDTNFLADAGMPRVHWQRPIERIPLGPRHGLTDWIVPPLLALRQAVLCQEEEHAIASIDSALRKQLIPHSQLDLLFATLPRRLHRLQRELDPLADSGTESIFGVRLRRLGHVVELQRAVPGSSKFDALIDDVVAVDLDSKRWHSDERQQLWDYDKTLQSFAWGRTAIRILPHHLFDCWPETLQAIERAVHDAQDLRRYRAGGKP